MSKNTLLLGSGMMVRPILEYLSSKGHNITIASNILADAELLASQFANTQAVYIDIANDAEGLLEIVRRNDLIISMIPATMHHFPLRAAIEAQNKFMVTASYVSPEVKELATQCESAGVTLMNELGFDPGIDHMTVAQAVRDIKNEGGIVKKFGSYCGALPHPDNAASNPLFYKFSWAPATALKAAVRPFKIYKDGALIENDGQSLMDIAEPFPYNFPYETVYYPNGDSAKYKEIYGIPECDTLMRCSIRYRKYTIMTKALIVLGIYNENIHVQPEQTWAEVIDLQCQDNQESPDLLPPELQSQLANKVANKLHEAGVADIPETVQGLQQLLILSDHPVGNFPNIFQAFAGLMLERLSYLRGQKDICILQHKIEVEHRDGNYQLIITIQEEGEPTTCSAISKLVGLPAAICGEIFLTKGTTKKGLLYPVDPELYDDILEELIRVGVHIKTERVSI